MPHGHGIPPPAADGGARYRRSISLPAADAAHQQPPRIGPARTVTEGLARAAAAAAAVASGDEEGLLHGSQDATGLEKIQVLPCIQSSHSMPPEGS